MIRELVIAARSLQHARLGGHRTNAKMTPREIRDTISLDAESQAFMRSVSERLRISAGVFDRLLKVGRTIADLAGAPTVARAHLAEAVQYGERKER